jgi:hypothetical protein
MANYKKIVEEALIKAKAGIIPTTLTSTKKLDESLVYPDGLKERMHPQLVDELINQKTSLGKHQFSQIVTKTLLNKNYG